MAELMAPHVEASVPNGVHPVINAPGKGVIAAPKRTPLHQLYRQPVPLRTFPLPTFYPANPLSLLHVAYVWIQQVVSPPPPEPAVVYTGVWSEATRSVHVLERRDMEALWYNGFFGKGSLSRSEPTWKKRMLAERSAASNAAAEQIREKRRDDRHTFKWERARLEQLAIESARLAEGKPLGNASEPAIAVSGQPQASKSAENSSPQGTQSKKATADTTGGLINGSAALSARPRDLFLTPPASPVTPLGLLKLPNSVLDHHIDLDRSSASSAPGKCSTSPEQGGPPVTPWALLTLPNSVLDVSSASSGVVNGSVVPKQAASSILPIPLQDISDALGKPQHVSEVISETSHAAQADDMRSVNSDPGSKGLKRQKSVRFSPTVESTTFRRTDPPSPRSSPPTEPKYPNPSEVNGAILSDGQEGTLSPVEALTPTTTPKQGDIAIIGPEPSDFPDREHLQLSMDEAFFLTFGAGALSVINPANGSPFTNEQLFILFREHSHIPPQMPGLAAGVSSDDPFLTRYAVYHRYRSLGWVVRDGIKFGVDLLLYLKGPVFSHAEFALVIMPPKGGRSWHWLHAVNRTLAAVFKSLVLVYVDAPAEGVPEVVGEGGVAGLLQQYRIREVMVKRWSGNRNR